MRNSLLSSLGFITQPNTQFPLSFSRFACDGISFSFYLSEEEGEGPKRVLRYSCNKMNTTQPEFGINYNDGIIKQIVLQVRMLHQLASELTNIWV